MKKTIICMGMALLSLTSFATPIATKGPEPKISRTTFNASPLCVAISKGDIEVVKKFIEYGASINEYSNGMTPLMFAARYNNVEILKLLIANGADISLK